MNERIRKLWEQANTRHINDYALSGTPREEWRSIPDMFAELIVRECANVALEQKEWVEDQIVFNPRDKEWNLARIQQSQRIVDKIKEHFGV